jgi:hypothetical protein
MKEVLKSLRVEFESTELDVQWEEKWGTLSNAYFEVECKDISRFLDEDTCRLEIIMKKLNTSLKCCDEMHRPLSFELLGVHLQQEYLGARLSGSRIQWIPPVENEVLNFICSMIPSRKHSRYFILHNI